MHFMMQLLFGIHNVLDYNMKNRYGDEYEFVEVDENTYTISGKLKYWRYGGKEGQSTIDLNDLGMVDPSGGPFISIGSIINGRKVIHISATDEITNDNPSHTAVMLKVE